MIQLSSIPVETITNEDDSSAKRSQTKSDWKAQLSQCRITTRDLLKHLELDDHPLANSEAEALFELRVPPAYLNKIKPKSPNDPLLLQVLPQHAEFNQVDGYQADPLLEVDFFRTKGLIHKYQNRVLLITNSSCAINCRYCFRRHFPYEAHKQARSDWQEALDYINNDTAIDEVILSGGEPLLLNNQYLFELISKIESIDHIKRIRIHTRLLTTIPARADQAFLNGIKGMKTKLIIVTHCNHAQELGVEHEALFSSIKQAGATLLNQAVLLKGINDDAEILGELSLKLFDLGVMPYYLFLLDKVAGAAHFDLSEEEARTIHKSLQARLPGYLVPRLTVEIANQASKTLLA